jgi:hypothetical protein
LFALIYATASSNNTAAAFSASTFIADCCIAVTAHTCNIISKFYLYAETTSSNTCGIVVKLLLLLVGIMTAITKASASSITVLTPITASNILAVNSVTASNYNVFSDVTAISYHGSKTSGYHLILLDRDLKLIII